MGLFNLKDEDCLIDFDYCERTGILQVSVSNLEPNMEKIVKAQFLLFFNLGNKVRAKYSYRNNTFRVKAYFCPKDLARELNKFLSWIPKLPELHK